MVLAFAVIGVGVMIGIAIAVERTGSSKNEPLTQSTSQVEFTEYEPETRTSSSGGAGRSTVEGANVEYRYRAGGRWFESSGPIWRPLSGLSDKTVCFDPDDPARHVLRGNAEATCGEGNLGKVRRSKEVSP
ncbi:hypothetical protein GEV29_09875 [Aeromicrobium sp. SMF47]|uniref:Uncharacterized protein n=1 Tax=Aeromicrobium yanjiei TaxID=2662028 RepID=A0A5Q2MLQ8_9ACTN|nr:MULTISPECIES: hypothetical protein [Aeromicrobium]MRJ76844.1 hypothetical protein [Aeromicrobium yanjiei]MRK01188.1 hypothetical protein [Aeromicrobium sp. S22]QGG42022.1 hypothetical protein GEV26_11945 [Aeromicrobium yanjiei]